MTVEDHQVSINRWVALAVPLFILAASGYCIYVVLQKLCIEYLLEPAHRGYLSVDPRPSLAVPILVFFFLLFVLYLGCYIRLIQTVNYNPGYTKRIPHPRRRSVQSKEEEAVKSSWTCVPSRARRGAEYPVLNRTAVLDGSAPPPPGIEEFLRKDVFICDPQGLPLFCDMCNNWKPDRTHHCSEVERCVRRMDHFCPWVGGIVSETNIKFFLQFLFYAAGWGIYTFGFVVWAITDRAKESNKTRSSPGQSPAFSRVQSHWIVAAALTGLLGLLFAGGMFLTTLYNAATNRSTNEQVIKRSYNVAVRIKNRGNTRYNGPTITFPLRGMAPSSDWQTFAILQTTPSDNIWSVGVLKNLKSVLGDSYVDWILPLNYPPCTKHDDPRSDFPLGADFERLCKDHGLD